MTIRDELYVVSKDSFGRIRFFRQNFSKVDDHKTTIYTRGYMANFPGESRSVNGGSLYFRRLAGKVGIDISYLHNNEWVCGSSCEVCDKLHRFKFQNSRCKTDDSSIAIKIDIDHKGCRFELDSVKIMGEDHRHGR